VCVQSDSSNENMYTRVQVCDCATYNEYCNLLNLDNLSLALSYVMSLRTRYGNLEKVLKIEDYLLKKSRSE
jgi:hypothetical protein